MIKNGYKGKSASCAGNGSAHGIVGSSQTLGARLSVAQQNSAQISETDARQILEEIRLLKLEAALFAGDRETRFDLTSPLREAATLVQRAKTPGQRGQMGHVSATTPTHLAELFIQRTQHLAPELGQYQAQHLTTQAYCLISEMEGQSEPGKECQGPGLQGTH